MLVNGRTAIDGLSSSGAGASRLRGAIAILLDRDGGPTCDSRAAVSFDQRCRRRPYQTDAAPQFDEVVSHCKTGHALGASWRQALRRSRHPQQGDRSLTKRHGFSTAEQDFRLRIQALGTKFCTPSACPLVRKDFRTFSGRFHEFGATPEQDVTSCCRAG
jgi:hypothetical protein